MTAQGIFASAKGALAQRLVEPVPDAAKAEKGYVLVRIAPVESRLIDRREDLLDLVGRKAGGIEAGDDAAEAGPGNRPHSKTLLLEHAQHTDMCVSLGAATAQG